MNVKSDVEVGQTASQLQAVASPLQTRHHFNFRQLWPSLQLAALPNALPFRDLRGSFTSMVCV